jgi:hypothetical protein
MLIITYGNRLQHQRSFTAGRILPHEMLWNLIVLSFRSSRPLPHTSLRHGYRRLQRVSTPKQSSKILLAITAVKHYSSHVSPIVLSLLSRYPLSFIVSVGAMIATRDWPQNSPPLPTSSIYCRHLCWTVLSKNGFHGNVSSLSSQQSSHRWRSGAMLDMRGPREEPCGACHWRRREREHSRCDRYTARYSAHRPQQ